MAIGAGLFKDFNKPFFVVFARMRDPALEARIPKTLPVLVIQGELDPVGENLVSTRRMVERYNALGLTRIQTHYYPAVRGRLDRLEGVGRDRLAMST